MFNIGPEKFLMIAVVALVVLGPHKLPEAARTVGKFVNEVRRMSSAFEAQIRSAIDTPPHSDDKLAPPSERPTTAITGSDNEKTEPPAPDHRVA